MQLEEEAGLRTLSAETYRLSFATDRPFVFLKDAHGVSLAELFVLSSVHPLQDRDDTLSIGAWEFTEMPDRIVCTLRAHSSVWASKTYRFCCYPRRLTYDIEVSGGGRLAEAHYFGGYFSGQTRWGSGFFRSGQRFKKGFNPEPNTQEMNYFVPAASSVIDLTGVPLPGKAGWFFTPPPFAFAFELADGRWLGMGVEARPGHNRFTEYGYRGEMNAFSLSLSYEGHTDVDGAYRLPAIGFDFGNHPYDLLAAHVKALQQAGFVSGHRDCPPPGWWREPIFCGWGAQCAAAVAEKGRAPDYARQPLYETLTATLSEQGIAPGIMVIDDKWQATYGENRVDPNKWPDLPGFIHARHAAGTRVLLWLKAWDPEGIAAEECITNAAGLPLAVDPSHPAFERRLRESVRVMLGPDGYDADGFKIDFTARIPSGPGIRTHGDVWGLELMRLYLGIIHDEARRTKHDALVIAHTPHPYLADVLDMIRLNDINTNRDVLRAMKHRARVASIACPDALIDTDNWPIPNKTVWREYMALQPSLGVPSLYFASRIDSTGEPLEASDYALIRQVWADYRAALEQDHVSAGH